MIWYACYGSNTDLNRFLKYIQGGELIVNGIVKSYKSCKTDTTPPRQSEPYYINRKFYFAKESKTWNNQGVGFISTKCNKRSITYARLYLISEDQFTHLFATENSKDMAVIDYSFLRDYSTLDFNYNFYNRIIQLEKNYKGFPILTFTNKEILSTNSPDKEYIKLIANGIKATHKIDNNQLADYFVKSKAGLAKRTLLGIFNSHK